MAGLVDIVALISLDVTRALVAAGLGLGFDGSRYVAGAAPLAIVAASNTTPIVITTAQPHLVASLPASGVLGSNGLGGMSCIVSGVIGNLAANNVSTDANDLTIGTSQGVLAVPMGDATLALYGQDPTTGALVPLAGSGAYTGGGAIVPALVEGGILLGREHVSANAAPPRIVMVPVSSTFGARSLSVAGSHRAADIREQKARRAVRTDKTTFEARVWGQAATPNTAADFDVTRAMYHWLIDSVHALMAGAYEVTAGTWADQAPTATQRLKAGHEFVFGLTISTPVNDAPRPFATGITVQATGQMQLDGGTPELACQGTLT